MPWHRFRTPSILDSSEPFSPRRSHHDGAREAIATAVSTVRIVSLSHGTVNRGTRTALNLEYATIALSLGEAAAALVSGMLAGSLALIAFGSDSVIEVISAMLVLNQLRSILRRGATDSKSERRAHRTVGVLFFSLAAYVTANASFDLLNVSHASENTLGFVVCIVSIFLMPGLAISKRKASTQMARDGFSAVAGLMASDASETALCGLLSLSTLIGIGLTAWVGWWWADPVASLTVVYFAIREGREAWTCDDD